jgi:hypothetical protein
MISKTGTRCTNRNLLLRSEHDFENWYTELDIGN